MPQPYNVFTIYAREDHKLLSELLSQLKPLEIGGQINVWSDREINPGVQWEKEIVSHLETADIILILVSPAYYNSEYIHRVEIKRAVERHNRGEAKVLPIIVRPCSFEDDPVVSSLQVLPTDGKAVTDDEHWRSQDKAWLDVVNGVKRTLAELRNAENRHEQTGFAAEQAAERKKEKEERKRKTAAPVPWSRYAAIGGGALALLLAVWLVSKMFSPTDATFDYPMVDVAGGTFTMGSPASEEGRKDNECQHEITVGSFGIGKYEVTQAQWKAIMGNNPSYFKGCDDCPVEQVSWNDIQDFIKKLNAATSKNYRLPREAEWEFAAKGGNKSQNYKYAGGDNLDSVAWYSANSENKTYSVGGKSPNELGLHDMSGNVWEWCQDTWKPYLGCKANDCSHCLVLRGGAWDINGYYCRSANRDGTVSTVRLSAYGFRLAHD